MENKTKDSSLKSILYFSFGSWISGIISFLTVTFTAILLQPAEYGKAGLFTIANLILTNLILLGLDQSFVRQFYMVKPENRSKIFWNSITPLFPISILYSIIIISLWEPFSYFLFGFESFLAILLLIFTSFISTLDTFGLNLLMIKKKSRNYSWCISIRVITNLLITVFYAVFIRQDFFAVIFGLLFSHLISFIISFTMEKKFWMKDIFSFQLSKVKRSYIYGIPICIGIMLSILQKSVSQFFLRFYSNFSAVGILSLCFSVASLLTIINSGILNYWISASLEKYEENKNNVEFLESLSQIMIFASLTITFLVLIFKDIIPIIFGKSYQEATNVLPFILFIPLFTILTQVIGRGIYFKEKSYWSAISMTISLILNVIGCYFLIPFLDIRGAAIAAGLSSLVNFIIQSVISVYLYNVNYHFKKLIISLIILNIVSLFNTFTSNLILSFIINSIALILIFIIYSNQLKKTFEILSHIKSKLKFFNKI